MKFLTRAYNLLSVVASLLLASPDAKAAPPDGTTPFAQENKDSTTMKPTERPHQAWNFDRDEADRSPSGWSFRQTSPDGVAGIWKIAADPSAPSPPNTHRLQTKATDGTFNLAIVEKSSYQDLDLRVKVRADSGVEDQGGGLIWRCKDENNYYICRFNPLESNFRVYKVAEGKRQQLASAKIETVTSKWYDVRAVMIGDKITCYLDGVALLEASDSTFAQSGMIGLWTKSDASSSFDDLVVYKK